MVLRATWNWREIYDPTSGGFTTTGSMSEGRENHTASLLPSGMVLMAGGTDECALTVTATTDLYDPASGTFSPGPAMISARCNHAASVIASGDVLVAGGLEDPQVWASAQLFVATGSVAAP